MARSLGDNAITVNLKHVLFLRLHHDKVHGDRHTVMSPLSISVAMQRVSSILLTVGAPTLADRPCVVP